MKGEEEIYFLLEQYFAGKLSNEEVKALTERLENNEEERNSAAFFLSVQKASVIAGAEYIKKTVRRDYQAYSARQQRNRFRNWSIAAGIIILVLVGILYRISSPTPSLEEMLAEYTTLVPSSIVRGVDSKNKVWEKAKQFYYGHAFDSASTQLIIVLKDTSFGSASSARLLLGSCYLEKQKYKLAASTLAQVSPESSSRELAEFFLAIAYIKSGQTKRAKALFQSIANTEYHSRKQEAKRLLRAIP